MSSLAGSTILVVDDERDIVTIVQEILEDEGAKVVPAYNGEMALALISAGQKIDLIFSDAQMPKMDGITLLKSIQSLGLRIPFCLVSGYSAKSESEIASIGAAGYLSKPFSASALVAMAAKNLSLSQPGSENTKKSDKSVVFVLEDDPVDQDLLRRAFAKHEFSAGVDLRFFDDGQQLIDVMKRGEAKPNLLVFDINLAGFSGLETLTHLRQQQLMLAETRVIILSSSTLKKDKERSLELGADCFYNKPPTRDAWWHLARSIHQSWLVKPDDPEKLEAVS